VFNGQVQEYKAADMPPEIMKPQKRRFRGYFSFRILDVDGTPLTDWQSGPNGNTNSGLNDILSVYFNAGTQKTAWYLGLVDNAAFSAFSTSDTIASHAGWNENTTVTNATRPQWSPSAPSGQSITNPTPANFTANGSITIHGAFLVSNNTLGGNSGQLWATGAFSSNQSLILGQVLQVTYTCSAS